MDINKETQNYMYSQTNYKETQLNYMYSQTN